MIGHQIDDYPQALRVTPPQQLRELLQAPRRVFRIVGAHVKIIPDCVWTARHSFENIRNIRRSLRIGGAARLFQHPGEPQVRDAQLTDGG